MVTRKTGMAGVGLGKQPNVVRQKFPHERRPVGVTFQPVPDQRNQGRGRREYEKLTGRNKPAEVTQQPVYAQRQGHDQVGNRAFGQHA